MTKVVDGSSEELDTGLLTPPPNVGNRTTPAYNDPATGFAVSGATTFADLDTYTKQTIYSLPSGEAVFAGPREDGFYADIPGIFDLLDGRILDNNGNSGDGLGQDGNGVDGFKGFNVLAFALQIPVADLPRFDYTAPFADLANPLPALGESKGIGVYASVSRKETTLRSATGDPEHSGRWIQVNRMGNPLFNEGLVALQDKDRYNRTSPPDDDATFATYALNPNWRSYSIRSLAHRLRQQDVSIWSSSISRTCYGSIPPPHQYAWPARPILAASGLPVAIPRPAVPGESNPVAGRMDGAWGMTWWTSPSPPLPVAPPIARSLSSAIMWQRMTSSITRSSPILRPRTLGQGTVRTRPHRNTLARAATCRGHRSA